MSVSYPRPSYRITLDGTDITPRINGRLVSLSLREQRGLEADQLDIVLTDHDGELAIPSRGAELSVAFGWLHEGLIDKGLFIVDEIQHQGTPDQLIVRARSADMRSQFPSKRSQSWHEVTLGDVIATLAGRNGLTPVISSALGSLDIDHLDQTDESDLHFLTRLGEHYDAIATVKAGRLLFTVVGEGKSASGQPMPSITLTRRDGDQHRYTVTDRDAYTGVKTFWDDRQQAERQEVIAGSEERVKRLRPTYATEADALTAARGEWQRLQRETAEFEMTLALGRADVLPESPLTVSGFKPQIDATPWLVCEVVHSLDDRGFVTQVRCEVKKEPTGNDGQP